MKKISILLVFLFIIGIYKSNAQYQIRIENERQVDATTYDLDIYFYATAGTWEFGTSATSILYNTSWPAGPITGAVVAGSSELSNTAQIPNATPNVGVAYAGTLLLAGKLPVGSGNGSIITTAGVRYVTIRLTCASGFTAAETPNFRFRFTSTPFQSLNVYISNTNTEVIGGGVGMANQASAFNPVYWNGTAWSGYVFDGITNGSGAAITAPTADLDATVLANYTATGNLSVRSLNLDNGKTFNMQSNTLNLGYKLNRNSATLNLSNATLVLAGNSSATQNQTLSIGATTVANLSFTGSGTKLFNDLINVTGTVSQGGTAILNANEKLVLKSSLSGTARIGSIAASTITGNVNIEQYIPAGKRAFRFIANPLSIALPASQIRDDIYITGPGTGATVLGTDNSNNFDHTTTGNPSAFLYNTANGNSSTTVDPGWTAIANGNTSTIPVGGAMRVLVRGDRSSTGRLDGTVTTANEVNLDFVGPINDGNAPALNLSKSTNSSFNFVGNPLNSNINSNSITANVALTSGIWVWNQALGIRGAYVAGVRSNNYVIPARSGFFLRVDDAVAVGTNVGAVTFPEGAKTATAATYQAFKTANDKIVMKVNSPGVLWDELKISFDEKFKSGNDYEDVEKMMNPDVSIFSVNTEGKILSIDQRKLESQNISLGFYTPGKLEFTFDFTGTIIPADVEYFFRDGATLTPITENTQYKTIIDGMTSPNTTRFGIVVEKKANGIGEQSLLSNAYNLYPNPVFGSDKISIAPKRILASNNQTTFQVIDLTGKVIISGAHEFNLNNPLIIPTENLSAGVYQVQIINSQTISNLPFVKQ